MRIEELWAALRREAKGAQRRIDATHPLDLYADFELPDTPGIILFTDAQPPNAPSLRAIGSDVGRRQDGRWTLRLYLSEPRLLPVFAELCRDIVAFTRTGVDNARAGSAVLSRLNRWQSLLQSQSSTLTKIRLRGLIGELLLLENDLIPALGPDTAIACWTGPLGTSQDFQLPDGNRIEVKALGRLATDVRINGLAQLDAGAYPLQLAVVRLEDTGPQAADAITAGSAVARIREAIAAAPVAQAAFEQLLVFAGWDDSEDTGHVVVRLDRIERFDVDAAFPKLIPSNVPAGIVDATYVLALPLTGVAQ